MLRKDNFTWTVEAEQAFEALRTTLTTRPILALPDFAKDFEVECDASNGSIRVIMSQDRHPIEYLSKALSEKHKALSVHDKEMLAVVYAMEHWWPYLLGRKFKILIDHQIIRYFLEQRITTPTQEKWLLKLLGYNYEIEYRAGARSYGTLILSIQNNTNNNPKYTLSNNCHYFKGMVFGPSNLACRGRILEEFHSTPAAACDTCQRQKYESIKPPSLLQPLLVPDAIWQDIAMDFIEGLPPSKGKNCILVVVDRLSKYGHFLPLKHPYTAEIFIREVFKLHGMPHTIVSDRDPTFLSQFWTSFFSKLKEPRSAIVQLTIPKQMAKLLLRGLTGYLGLNGDKHKTEREFQIGDWVYLRLQPYRQATLHDSQSPKLAPYYYNPFQITSRVGTVAYKLALPVIAKISLLKKKLGSSVVPNPTLPPISDGAVSWTPAKIFDRGIFKR
ncbi:unnamed protein product [Prunus armeniaca]